MVHPGAAPLSRRKSRRCARWPSGATTKTGAGGSIDRNPRDDYFETIARMIRPAAACASSWTPATAFAGLYAPALLRRIGCEVVELYCGRTGAFRTTCPIPRTSVTSKT